MFKKILARLESINNDIRNMSVIENEILEALRDKERNEKLRDHIDPRTGLFTRKRIK